MKRFNLKVVTGTPPHCKKSPVTITGFILRSLSSSSTSVMAPTLAFFPVVTLVVLSGFPAAVSSRRDVLELGDADFDYLATEHETMLVKFYAPW